MELMRQALAELMGTLTFHTHHPESGLPASTFFCTGETDLSGRAATRVILINGKSEDWGGWAVCDSEQCMSTILKDIAEEIGESE